MNQERVLQGFRRAVTVAKLRSPGAMPGADGHHFVAEPVQRTAGVGTVLRWGPTEFGANCTATT